MIVNSERSQQIQGDVKAEAGENTQQFDQKVNKKKNNKKKNKKEKEEDTDYEIDLNESVKNAQVHKCTEIPEHIRQRLAVIEMNPYNLMIETLPLRTSIDEMKEYFNTIVTTFRPELEFPSPVQALELSTFKNFAHITFSSKQAKEVIKNNILKQTKEVELAGGNKLTLAKPKEFFKRFVEQQTNQLELQGLSIGENGGIIKTEEGVEGVKKEEGQEQQQEKLPNSVLEVNNSSNAPGVTVLSNGKTRDDVDKVYMGGFPLYLKEEQVRQIAEQFGPLRFFSLIKEFTDDGQVLSKGYCFFQYQSPTATDKAVKGLNGLDVGDRKIKCSRATAGQQKSAAAYSEEVDEKLQPANSQGSYLAGCDTLKYDYVQEMLSMPESSSVPSTVVQFLNMVSYEDLFEDDIYEELLADIREECAKFGQIVNIIIPRPDKETGLAPASVGKVFVKYQYLLPAKKARHNLSGRTYNKRTVIASFYPEEKFKLKEYLVTI